MDKLKPGHRWILVKDFETSKWEKRILTHVFEYGVVVVCNYDEEKYFNNKPYELESWKMSKELPLLSPRRPLDRDELTLLMGTTIIHRAKPNNKFMVIGVGETTIAIWDDHISSKELMADWTYLNENPISKRISND